MVDGVIFDMDGLMFDTEPIWYDSWEPALAKFGLTLVDGLPEAMRGLNGPTAFAVIRKYLGEDVPAEEIMLELRRVAEEGIRKKLIKKPGLDDLLRYLDQRGIPCAVASASLRGMVEHNLHAAGVDKYFSVVLCGDDVTDAKPNPQIFLKAADRLGVEPSSCMVLEDSFAGVRAGAAGGFITVMVPDLAEPDDEISSLYTQCCRSLNEVRERMESGAL